VPDPFARRCLAIESDGPSLEFGSGRAEHGPAVAAARPSDVPGRLCSRPQCPDQDRPELGRRDTEARAGGAAADPGVPPEPFGRPPGCRDDRRASTGEPEGANATSSFEEEYGDPSNDL